METSNKTVSFGGGFTDARTVRLAGCRAEGFLPRDYGTRHRVVDTKKDARPVLQHRTGVSISGRKLTEDSIARMPRWERWGLYALCGLTLSGVLPMFAASLLIWLCDIVGWWLLIPICIVVGRGLWRVMWS